MSLKPNSMLSVSITVLWRHVAGIIIANIVLYALANLFDTTWGLLLSEVILLFVYAIPSYVALWAIGNGDINRVKTGERKKDSLRGLKIGLIATSPNILLGILLILAKFGLFPNVLVLFKVVNAQLVPLTNLIKSGTWAMPDYTVWQIVLVASLTLIPPILCGIFYLLGNHDFMPTRWLVYKKDPKAPNPKIK